MSREQQLSLTVDQLVLRTKEQENPMEDLEAAGILFCPPVDEDYWAFQVGLSESQALSAFPKFGTLGIGFAVEEDWNTNLPFVCSAEVIYKHIEHNKGDDSISKEVCLAAIEMLREACRLQKGYSDEFWASEQERVAKAGG